MSDTALDPAKSEAFGNQMIGAINGAGFALLASIGRQVGLFDIVVVDFNRFLTARYFNRVTFEN